MQSFSLLLLFVAFLANHSPTTARNPGLKIKLSEAGLNYAAKVAVDKLSADVRTKTIPSSSGSSGVLRYGISNTRITGFTSPSTFIRTDPNSGLTMALAGIGVSVHGDWFYRLSWTIFRLSDSGSFDVSVSGMSLTVSIGMGVSSTGRPTIQTKSCRCRVGDVNVRFHGGASWFYNIFSCYVEEKISDKIESQLCSSIKTVINEKARRTLQNMKVRVPINSMVTLDYSLVAAPTFADNYLQFLHRGEFYWTERNFSSPTLPLPMEELAGAPKMITFCMSDYVSNSLGYVLYQHGRFILNYTLTESDLPSNVRHLLRLVNYPEIGSGYPNGIAELLMQATEQPTLHTDKNGIKGSLGGTIEMKIRLPTGELKTLLALDVKMELTLTTELANEKILARVQDFRLSIVPATGHISQKTQLQINNLVDLVAQHFIVPKLNEVGWIGVPLPLLNGVKYENPDLHLLNGAVCLSSDVRYVP